MTDLATRPELPLRMQIFDEGDRDRVRPGIYNLTPPRSGRTLASRRARVGSGKRPNNGLRPLRIQSHTERVVMASRI